MVDFAGARVDEGRRRKRGVLFLGRLCVLVGPIRLALGRWVWCGGGSGSTDNMVYFLVQKKGDRMG